MILPLVFQYDDVFPHEPRQRMTMDIIHEKHGKIGLVELFLIQGSEDLKVFVDEYRDDPYSNWEPMDVFHAIEYDEEDCIIDGKIAYLKTVKLEKEYRGLGFGTEVISQVMDYCEKEKVNYVILQPSPILDEASHIIQMKESEEHQEKRLRLTKFYQEQFGFEKVPTKQQYPYPIYYKKLK